MAAITFLITLSFLFSTPRVVDPAFPGLSAFSGQFLMKNVLLLGGALWSLRESLEALNNHRSSRGKVAVSPLDMSEQDNQGRPVAYRLAGCVVTGNEDGAHCVINEMTGALLDIGFTVPGQAWTYWNKGTGIGESYLETEYKQDLRRRTQQYSASNLVAVASALYERPIPAPGSKEEVGDRISGSSPEPLYSTRKNSMPWYVYFAHFFAVIFLTNGIPHFVNGISGHRFQTPFASPPAVGESSPIINVLWGMANIAIGLLLVLKVGEFEFALNPDTLTFFGGAFLIAIVLAWHFGRVRNQ